MLVHDWFVWIAEQLLGLSQAAFSPCWFAQLLGLSEHCFCGWALSLCCWVDAGLGLAEILAT